MGAVDGMLLHVSTLAAGNITPPNPPPSRGRAFPRFGPQHKTFPSKNIIPVT
jgi:hypothetical protein